MSETKTTRVFTAGAGSDGKLGHGSASDSAVFAEVIVPSEVKEAGGFRLISAGSYNTCFVSSNSVFVCGLIRSPKDGSSVAGMPLGSQKQQQQQPIPRSPSITETLGSATAAATTTAAAPTTTATAPPKHPLPVPPQRPPPSTPATPPKPSQSSSRPASASATSLSATKPLTPARPAPPIPPTPEKASQQQPQEDPSVAAPLLVPMPSLGARVKQIALGNYHALLLTDAGRVFAWGSSRYGQLGLGSLMPTATPELVGGLSCVQQIACGTTYSAAVTQWGELLTWGENTVYQLGHGDTTHRVSPTRVNLLKGCTISKVSCGTSHVMCLTRTGDLYTWGQSTKDGQVTYLPSQVDLSDIVTPPIAVSKIACGGWHSTIVLNTGLVYEWQLGEDLRTLSGEISTQSIRVISCGNFHTVAVSDAGVVYTCGRNNCSQLARPAVKGSDPLPAKVEGIPVSSDGSGSAVHVSAGEFHTAVLTDDSARFSAARKLLAMVREHFRKLCMLAKVYYSPIIGRYEMHQPEAPTKRKRKSFSFSLKRAESKEALPRSPTGGRSSMRLLPATIRGRAFTVTTAPPTVSPSPPLSPDESPRHDKTGRRMSFGHGDKKRSLSPQRIGATGSPVPPAAAATVPASAGSSANMAAPDELFLTEEEISTIFGSIDEMLSATAELLAQLDEKIDSWSLTQTIGDVVLAEPVMQSFRQYIDWSDAYIEAQMTLFGAKRRSVLFAEFLREIEATSKNSVTPPVRGDTDLKSLLIVPAQFVARMLVAFRDLASATAPSHPDAGLLAVVLDKLGMLLGRVNQNFQFVDELEILHCTSDETGNPQLMGGTLQLLMERLTHHNIADPKFTDIFLLTYHTFCSPTEFLRELVARYKALQSAPLQARQRVFLVLSAWVTNNWHEIEGNADNILGHLSTFLSGSWLDEDAKRFTAHIKEQISMQQSHPKPPAQLPSPRPVPAMPLTPTKSGKTPPIPAPPSVMDFSADAIAHALAVQDHMLFRAIEIREWFGKLWEKSDAAKRCPNLIALTARFNSMSSWAAAQVTSAPSKLQLAVASKLLEVAERCFAINNISSFVALVLGLLASSTTTKFRKDLGKESAALLESYESLVSPLRNHRNLRAHVTQVRPPCVPFLGVVLKDLIFIEDGNSDTLPSAASSSQPIINFFKRRKLAEVVLHMRQLQQVPFVEERPIEPALWNFVLNL